MDDVGGGRSVLYDDIVRIRGFPDDGLIDDKRSFHHHRCYCVDVGHKNQNSE